MGIQRAKTRLTGEQKYDLWQRLLTRADHDRRSGCGGQSGSVHDHDDRWIATVQNICAIIISAQKSSATVSIPPTLPKCRGEVQRRESIRFGQFLSKPSSRCWFGAVCLVVVEP